MVGLSFTALLDGYITCTLDFTFHIILFVSSRYVDITLGGLLLLFAKYLMTAELRMCFEPHMEAVLRCARRQIADIKTVITGAKLTNKIIEFEDN